MEMRFHLITNLTKFARIQYSNCRYFANSGFYRHNLQCRLYKSFQFGNINKIPQNPSHFPSRFRFLHNSSPNSKPKMGFLLWYLGLLDSRPIITKSISSALIYAAADITTQTITMEPYSTWDSIRTLRMAAYGMFILGPAQHMWFNFAAKVLPKRDVITTFKKLLMGQLVYGPSITASFFVFNAVLQGENRMEVAARLKRDLLPTLLNGLMYWPICDFFTYKIIPVHLQPLMNSSFSYLWTIYLTYMASLKKAVLDQ